MTVEDPRCDCGGEAIEPHTCPFQTEINDDYDFECDCCEHGEDICRDEI